MILLTVELPARMPSALDCRWHSVERRRAAVVDRRRPCLRSSTFQANLKGSKMTTPPNRLTRAEMTW